ncbi:structure structural component [Xenorhabdus mauleonii]|uniref:Structure structural component n=1 Tax=Xenorhabdus mauleonii TaxID=351675 RepID=A0A1I3XV22_9GAMM|nr:hypothetical protein [Xenorhabdus mauleonii]PHM45878.1 structure structural component [Xenorhabdus mauleonii]SFK23352.1 hypothetical protein SAMN05421680_13911 [Xenorhabdus mauleonii]
MKDGDLFKLLKPVLPGRVFPYLIPLTERKSDSLWCVFSTYSLTRDVLSGPAVKMTRIQVDAYAPTLERAEQIGEDALHALNPLAPFDVEHENSFEEDTELYRASLTCKIYTQPR